MISRHIPIRDIKKSSFSELAKYLQNPQNKQERVGAVKVTNCQQENIVDAVQFEIERTQRQNTRSEDDKTYHLLISFRAGENPSQAVLDAIETRMCAAMGYEDHQRVSAVHYDTDNVHIHIAINKIHPETYNIHTPYNDYKIRSSMCQVFEKKFGLETDNHKATKTRSENNANDMERHSGIESFLGWIKKECSDELKQAESWQQLHQVMQANGLELRQKGNGFVITGPDGVGVKASSVDRSLSRTSLEKKFGEFEPISSGKLSSRPTAPLNKHTGSAFRVKRPGDRPPPMREGRFVGLSDLPSMEINSGKRYEGRPLHSQGSSTTELYAKYKNEQQRLTATRNEALRLAKVKRDRLIENAKRTGRLKRSAIKLLKGAGVNKRHLYGLVSKSLSAEVSRANAIFKKDRQSAYDIHKRRTWADWLQHKASNGDDLALKTLRQRDAQAARKEANSVHGEKVKQDGRIPGLKPDSVTKEGTIIYRVGDSAIRDGGKFLDVSRDAGDDGLHAALLMAKHRYGNQLTVSGSFEFKKRIVAVAAVRELDVSFADPELEKLRQILTKKAASEREYIPWFVGTYATRDRLENFIRMNEEKDNEQRRQRNTRTERSNPGRERSSAGNAAGADEPGFTGRSPSADAGTGYGGDSRSRGRTGTGDGVTTAGSQPGRTDDVTRAGRSRTIESNGERRHSKPNVARPGRQPPPTAKNRLRAMSELGMVRIAGGSEVLLQGNVSDQLEHKTAERSDQLRWDMAGAGGIITPAETKKPQSSAEKYINEREQKRLKWFDIQKHRGYNSTDKGLFEYAGQRKIGLETLALLKRNDEIIVMPVSDYTARRLSSLKVGESVTLTPSGSVRTTKGRSR